MPHTPSIAAIVHTDLSHPEGAPITRRWIDGSWPLRSQDPLIQSAYLRPITVLVAVAYRRLNGRRTLAVIDVRRVAGYTISGTRVNFSTVPAPDLAHLIGQSSPVVWSPGEGWPIKLIQLATNGRAAA